MSFADYALRHLPPAPARVLEVGCGVEGGVTPTLLAAGYDVLAIDPRAPAGPAYRQVRLEELREPGPFEAVVAGRVLHHVDPLAPALDRLVSLAPLLVIDEFAWNEIDPPTQAWYEERYQALVAAGGQPHAPASLDEWRGHHVDLHPYERLRDELGERYDDVHHEWRPYFYHWLGAEYEADERAAIAAGEIRPIGVRWVGRRR